MKKLFVLLALGLVATGWAVAAPLGSGSVIYKDVSSGLWFRCDLNAKTAVVIADQSENKTDYFEFVEDLVIPYSINVSNATIGTQGSGTESYTEFVVTSVEQDAFVEICASGLVFANNSQVTTLGSNAFYNAWFAGTITLPSKLKLIESQALAIYSDGADDHITKIVIPESVDSLCLSAIVLDAVEEIVFLGTVPPHCQVLPAVDGTAYNPWTQEDEDNPATPKTTKVTIPTGAYDAYNNCYGIGDYFSCFSGPVTPTGVNEVTAIENAPTKTLRNGHMVIQRNGVCYSVLGQRR